MAKPNRLAAEKSPYLLEHANNPVDWYPWGKEALARAKNDAKPIFLSIGYSTCHWCHQMRKESFEDPAVAAIMNKNFISIKVDREERPEVDAYYMSAVQAMTGGGGWPLSVFLTPDLKPFYGGTYYPPEPRYGMPSFRQVLEFVADLWKQKRQEIVENGERVSTAVLGEGPKTAQALGPEVLDEGYQMLVASFDQENGGFGRAPKFPLPLASEFMLRRHYRTGKELALKSVTKTLDGMAAGGIRDHIGGGFHRYSTDKVWLVPHFEKMLYDNALLLKLYVEAYQVTKKEDYARVARETAGWLLTEMAAPEGGFYSAQDADTTEGEGTYYTWTMDELAKAMGEGPAAEFCASYGVTKNGNFEGRSILHLTRAPGSSEDNAKVKAKLYGLRLKRPRPATDTKVLTSWNGLTISALAYSGMVLEEEGNVRTAERAAEFILQRCMSGETLLRRYAGGEAGLDGTLEDYAFFVQGLIDLFEATSEPKWLSKALELTDRMESLFEDKEGGGFYLTVDSVPARLKEGYDGPTPSGNSVAALNLARLSELTGNAVMRKKAKGVLEAFGRDISQQPSGHANMLVALDFFTNGGKEIVMTAKSLAAIEAMKGAVYQRFIPDRVLMVADSNSYKELASVSSLLEGREPAAKARAYVCQNFACKLPADTVEALKAQL